MMIGRQITFPGARVAGPLATNWVRLTLLFVLWGAAVPAHSQQDLEPVAPSLGVSKMIEQVVLPGSLLTHKKVDPTTTPLIVRVVRTFPHGDAFRYDISYFGMTPGEFDLRDFLVREDGSSTDDLPPLPVTVTTILDEGQVEPNELEVGALSRYGGYWQLLLLGSIVWVAILVAIIFVGRKPKKMVEVQIEKKVTLAELLQPSIEQAMAGRLPKEKYAELERLLFGFWQKKLRLTDVDPASALNQIRSHEESAPLMKQIELWLHSPGDAGADVDLAKLLAPYRKFDADEVDVDETEKDSSVRDLTLGAKERAETSDATQGAATGSDRSIEISNDSESPVSDSDHAANQNPGAGQ